MSKAGRLRACETLCTLTIMSKEALTSIPGPTAGSNAYYNTHSCGDGGFSGGFLHGASRALFGTNTGAMSKGTKIAPVSAHEIIIISILVSNSWNWLHSRFSGEVVVAPKRFKILRGG